MRTWNMMKDCKENSPINAKKNKLSAMSANRNQVLRFMQFAGISKGIRIFGKNASVKQQARRGERGQTSRRFLKTSR